MCLKAANIRARQEDARRPSLNAEVPQCMSPV